MLLSVQIVFLSLLFHQGSSVCNPGWFGPNCYLKCLCFQDQCNVDGECMQGSHCLEGWFGPACQYDDLVYRYGNVSYLWARDGDDRTCNLNPQLRSLFVTFPKPFNFTWLRMVTFNGSAGTTLQIRFNNNALPCAYQRIYAFNSRIMDIACDISERIMNINITGVAVGYLCSLYVSGGRNFAVKQPANQSSTYNEANFNFTADLAVDGDRDGSFYNHHCSSTDLNNSSWTLFFRESRVLTRIVLLNRDDLRQRLWFFTLRTYSSSGTVLDSFTDTDNTVYFDFYDISLNSTTATSTIAISNPGTLTLCEVRAYGELQCPGDKWGLNCSKTCRCGRNETCLPPTGLCSAACPDGFYGPACATACPTNCEGDSCQVRSGDCFECKDGYQGVKCVTECATGLFGKKCMHQCSQDCLGGLCIPTNGDCVSCKTGFYGDTCLAPCPPNCKDHMCIKNSGECMSCDGAFYGSNCSTACPVNCENKTCEFTTGFCSSCDGAFYGSTCSTACPVNCKNNMCDFTTGYCYACEVNFYGDTCSNACSATCERGLCNNENGSCFSCKAGFYGHSCNYTCPSTCLNNQCGFTSGLCSHAQAKDETKNAETSILPFIILLLVCCVVFALLLPKKKSTKHNNEES